MRPNAIGTTAVRLALRLALASFGFIGLGAGLCAAEPKGPAAYVEDQLTSGGKSVRVWRFEPAAPGKHPVLVVLPAVHGADGAEGKPYLEQAGAYARKGYVILLVHYQDATELRDEPLPAVRQRVVRFFQPRAARTPKDEQTLAKHFENWAAAAEKAVKYARGRPNVDRQRVGLVGFSLGGAVALRAAGRKGADVRAVVNLFGGLPQGLCRELDGLPPVLLLHGDLDERVPPGVAYAMWKVLRAKKIPLEFKMYQEVGHVGHGAGPADLLDMKARVDAFLGKHLSTAEQARKER